MACRRSPVRARLAPLHEGPVRAGPSSLTRRDVRGAQGPRKPRAPRTPRHALALSFAAAMARALRPETDRAALAARLGRRAHLGGRQRPRDGRADLLRARDAALPERRAAHRAPEELLGRRRGRALPPAHRPPRPASDGLRRVRPAGREPRDQDRPAPARVDRPSRSPPSSAQFREWGISIDWTREFATHEPRYYRWTQWIFLQLFERGLAYRKEAAVKWCPERPDRARQRAGHRRPLRALRREVEVAPARAVVLPHHRLRRPPARRPRHDRVARARQDDAAQLDRPLRGRRGHLPLRGAGHRLPGLHDAPRHAVRRDLLRDGARAPRRRSASPRAPSTRRRCATTSTTR